MAGRIRTLKPEWLEDQRLLACSERARLLTVVLILIADDYGNGRGHPDFVKAQAGLYDVTTPDLESALFELQNCGFIELYLHNQQSYFSIRNWDKHQRVDKPGKPRVPPPSERDKPEAERPRKSSYFIRGTLTGLIKIGESIDPVARLGDLAACGSEPLELLAVCSVPERTLHAELAEHRVHGEWFTPSDAVIAKIREHSRGAISVLATAGYANGRKILESSEKVPERFRTDHDHDHEEDRDREREARQTGPAAPAALPLFVDQPDPPAPAKPDDVAELWAEQERLRAEVIPGSRALDLTADRRKRIAGLLKSGHTAESLRSCLAAYADEIRNGGDSQWFNGESNWRPDNVARTLGRIGSKPAAHRSTIVVPPSPPRRKFL